MSQNSFEIKKQFHCEISSTLLQGVSFNSETGYVVFYQNGLTHESTYFAPDEFKGIFAENLKYAFVSYGKQYQNSKVYTGGTRSKATVEFHEKFFEENEAANQYEKSKSYFKDNCFE